MTSSSPEDEIEIEDVEIVAIAGEVRAIEPVSQSLPAVQAAAVAATGFAVGAATVAVIARRSTSKKPRLRKKKKRKRGELIDVASSRSFLVDVHLLNRG